MSVPSSWGLPMWGGLASPMASKNQLYNSWVNGSQQGALAQAAKAKAEADAKALSDAQAASETSLIQDLSGNSSFGSLEDGILTPVQTGTGLEVASSGSNSTGPSTGDGTYSGGVGLSPIASKAVGTAASIGLGAIGMPMSRVMGNIIGQMAGDGINGGSVFNMGLGKVLGLINPALGIPYAIASMLGLDAAQGISEITGLSKPTPGFEGGFFGKQGLGGGLTLDGGSTGLSGNTIGGYSPDGSGTGSVGVGGQNAGADSNGTGLGGMAGAGIGGSTAAQAMGGIGGYSPGPSPSPSPSGDSNSSPDGGGMKRGGLVSYSAHLARNENSKGPLSRCSC